MRLETLTEKVKDSKAESSIHTDPDNTSVDSNSPQNLIVYLIFGTLFGIVLVKSEVVSWFRIQEMFLFDNFHMYGVIGSAVMVAALSVQIIKRFNVQTVGGEPINIAPKKWGNGVRYWLGGTLFGLGWSLLGACPGPIFALIGGGTTVLVMGLVGALAGTWTYALLRPRLPH